MRNRISEQSAARAQGWLLAGLAVAPPTAVLVALITYEALWYGGMMSGGAPIDTIDAAVAFGLGVGIIAVAMTMVAAPFIYLLSARAPLTLGKILLLGATLGNVPFALIVLGIVVAHPVGQTMSGDIGRFWYGVPGFVQRVVLGLACGTVSAAAYWAVAARRASR